MKLKSGSCMTLFFVLLGIICIILTLRFEYGETKRFPLLLAGVMSVLAIKVLSKEIITGEIEKATDESETAPSQDPKAAGKELHLFGSALAWTAGFLLSVSILGFVIGSLLFAFSYSKLHGRGWLVALSFAVIMTAAIYAGTEWAFDMPLPKGLLLSW